MQLNEYVQPTTILIAEDDPDDRFLTQKAFEEAQLTNTLQFVDNGEALLDYLYRRGQYANPNDAPRPSLILLDLNMPKIDGREALAEIKTNPNLRQIPIVIFSTSRAEKDIYNTYDLGASSFITKPVTFDALVEIMQTLGKYWFKIVKLPPQEGKGYGYSV